MEIIKLKYRELKNDLFEQKVKHRAKGKMRTRELWNLQGWHVI